MKRGTPHHPKTTKLARLLKVKQFGAVGILESLWHFTAKYAIQGDVGRFSDADIAEACFWEKSPALLVKSLVDAGWLDEHPEHRLLVHDWQEHADQSVQKTLRNRALLFLTNSRMIPETVGPGGRNDSIQPEPEPEPEPKPEPTREGGEIYPPDFEMFWQTVPPRKRGGKMAALQAYKNAVKILKAREEDPHAFLRLTADAYYASPLGQTQYASGAAPFLNQGHYDDDPQSWERKEGTHGTPKDQPGRIRVPGRLPLGD